MTAAQNHFLTTLSTPYLVLQEHYLMFLTYFSLLPSLLCPPLGVYVTDSISSLIYLLVALLLATSYPDVMVTQSVPNKPLLHLNTVL